VIVTAAKASFILWEKQVLWHLLGDTSEKFSVTLVPWG